MTPPTVLYVGPQGDDRSAGTTKSPLRTLDGARLAARKHRGSTIVVELLAGTYRLSRPVVFGELDSGDVTYRAAQGARVVICSSEEFQPNWHPYKGPMVQCQVPKGFETDQIFLNGSRRVLARYPNEDPSVRIFHGFAKDAISPERVRTWSQPEGGFVHAMHPYLWGDVHYRILGKKNDQELNLEGGWQNNRPMGMSDEYRFVEGIFEELDAPGEWFLNRSTRTLYYYPMPNEHLEHSSIEGPTLSSLLEFENVHGLKFSGITFRHTLRTFMQTREPLLRSDWAIYRGGAVHFRGSSDCEISDCDFKSLGGNAIFVDGKNRGISIRRCLIQDVGASGVCFVGSPNAVRSPLFNADRTQSLVNIDRTPGPRTDDFPSQCLVEDCVIDRTGRVEKQTAGVEIDMASHIVVRHCSIYDVPRAGINIGDGCWGGNVIEGCDVFDTVQETGDHGSFNSWGRDRYWSLTDVDMNKGERPELSSLDAVEPNVLRNNRWRCDHGWDIDLDDGSSHYIIQNNLCLNGGLKNREGFDRLVENNVIVGNSFHPHVWFLNSGDVFRKNIVFTPYRPIGVKMPWGKQVDENLLHQPGLATPVRAEVLSEQSGRDSDSLIGDALFVDAAAGDFRVKPGSPALKLGFKNFAMDSFGVRDPRLRAIARRPNLKSEMQLTAERENLSEWLGAQIKNLVDPSEISATGTAEGQGVLVHKVSSGSVAASLGLQTLDVIRAVNGTPVRSVKALLDMGKSAIVEHLEIIRNQKTMQLP